jgi:hypothetical protein
MERLAILLALFVILVVLILARRQARRERAEAPAPVAMPAAAAALADAMGTSRPQDAAGARDPYARLGSCPSCGRPMVERVGKRGALKGKPYLVCSGDPSCGTVPADG